MKTRLQALALLSFLIIQIHSIANDGAFRAEGNQLIPMYETDVSVKKEILTIKRINDHQVQITVYYEFFNPKDSKQIEVGFEAISPSGDVDVEPVGGTQPYIDHFTVNLNGQAIPYKVSIVKDKVYYANGIYKAMTLTAAKKEAAEGESVDFFYVYHFKATFKNGINIIIHTYILDLSDAVYELYSLDYILTAAKRWANRQIDDFTLQIDMGELQDFCIPASFYNNSTDWRIDGVGKSIYLKSDAANENDTTEFFMRKGMLTFQQQNFKPIGELRLISISSFYHKSLRQVQSDAFNFDSRTDWLPFSPLDDYLLDPVNDLSKRIMRNLPFARRGYVFKVPEIKAYFERQPWYIPDPSYTPEVNKLTKAEQAWLQKKELQ